MGGGGGGAGGGGGTGTSLRCSVKQQIIIEYDK